MSKFFLISVNTILTQKTWVIALFLAIFLPWVLPYFTPVEYNRGLLEPARAQAAWSVTWLLGVAWAVFHASQLGAHNRKTGLALSLIHI